MGGWFEAQVVEAALQPDLGVLEHEALAVPEERRVLGARLDQERGAVGLEHRQRVLERAHVGGPHQRVGLGPLVGQARAGVGSADALPEAGLLCLLSPQARRVRDQGAEEDRETVSAHRRLLQAAKR